MNDADTDIDAAAPAAAGADRPARPARPARPVRPARFGVPELGEGWEPVDRADREGGDRLGDREAFSRVALMGELDALWPPAGLLEDTVPGPGLAALLNMVGPAELEVEVLVEYVAAAARQASWCAEREVAATAELTRRAASWRGVGQRGDQVAPEAAAAAEVGAALTLCPGTARSRVEFAAALVGLPATRLALAAGRIDPARARAVVEAVAGLGEVDRAAVEARVIGRAPTQTTALLRASLRRAVHAIDPDAAQARRDRAVLTRGVWREALPDGMARLEWVGAAEEVEATHTWITAKALAAQAAQAAQTAQAAQAAQTGGAGGRRSLDQARSDVLGDLGRWGLAVEDLPTRHGRRPHIGVVVALSTLIGADDAPAELVGVGPITAATARRIAAEGTWRRLLVDPRTGRLDEVSADTYAPPQEMADFVIARDRTCRGLGCRMPAERCDLDHRIPHPRGPTAVTNLDAACRSWHRMKTLTDTTVEADGDGGLWITLPSGRRYHRPADPTLDHPGLVVTPEPDHHPPDDPDPPTHDTPPF